MLHSKYVLTNTVLSYHFPVCLFFFGLFGFWKTKKKSNFKNKKNM